VVKKAVDKAGEDWTRRAAMKGDAATKDGGPRWNSIRSFNRLTVVADRPDKVL